MGTDLSVDASGHVATPAAASRQSEASRSTSAIPRLYSNQYSPKHRPLQNRSRSSLDQGHKPDPDPNQQPTHSDKKKSTPTLLLKSSSSGRQSRSMSSLPEPDPLPVYKSAHPGSTPIPGRRPSLEYDGQRNSNSYHRLTQTPPNNRLATSAPTSPTDSFDIDAVHLKASPPHFSLKPRLRPQSRLQPNKSVPLTVTMNGTDEKESSDDRSPTKLSLNGLFGENDLTIMKPAVPSLGDASRRSSSGSLNSSNSSLVSLDSSNASSVGYHSLYSIERSYTAPHGLLSAAVTAKNKSKATEAQYTALRNEAVAMLSHSKPIKSDPQTHPMRSQTQRLPFRSPQLTALRQPTNGISLTPGPVTKKGRSSRRDRNPRVSNDSRLTRSQSDRAASVNSHLKKHARLTSSNSLTNPRILGGHCTSCINILYEFWKNHFEKLTTEKRRQIALLQYTHLFEKVPSTRTKFPTESQIAHISQLLFGLKGWLIRSLANGQMSERWIDKLRTLGALHAKIGVSQREFMAMAAASHKALEEVFGTSIYTPRTMFAFQQIYEVIMDIFLSKDVSALGTGLSEADLAEFIGSLNSCLQHPTGKKHLSRFMKLHFSLEPYLFHERYLFYKSAASKTHSTDRLSSIGQQIQRSFFDKDSAQRIEFSTKCKSKMAATLQSNHNVYTPEIFDDAHMEVKLMIRTHLWGKFQSYLCKLNEVNKSAVLSKAKDTAINRVSKKRNNSSPIIQTGDLRNRNQLPSKEVRSKNRSHKSRRKPGDLKRKKAKHKPLRYDTDAPVLDLTRFTTFTIHE